MRQKANAWERRRVAYKVNCCCSLAGNKIFVERHLQSHFQAQCAFKVMRSTCPFSALPSPPPLSLSLTLSSLCQAVVLVFIAYIFGVFFLCSSCCCCCWQRQQSVYHFMVSFQLVFAGTPWSRTKQRAKDSCKKGLRLCEPKELVACETRAFI